MFISSDMEGTAGVVDWEHVRPGGSLYDYYVGLLTGEVNAAIEGAIEGGANEFLVNDSHGRMANLRPSELTGKASYLSGRFKPRYMMQGLDESFDAVFLLSYHGSMSSARAALSHTYFPDAFAEVRLNGQVTGEGGINALVARAYDVPVVLVTGDERTAQEMQAICPDIKAAIVKKSITRFAAESLHPDKANDLIRSTARQATEGVSKASPPAIALPATIDIRFHNTDYAQLGCRIAGVVSTGDLTATIEGDRVPLS
ncbi:MAG: M55 family metallopeptidase [Acidimicrobiales bacterium]